MNTGIFPNGMQPELEKAWKEINPILRGSMDFFDFKAGWDAAMKSVLRAKAAALVGDLPCVASVVENLEKAAATAKAAPERR